MKTPVSLCGLIIVATLILPNPYAHADTYLQLTQATVDITHMTFADSSLNRTELGIGEEVTCNASYWSDWDCNLTTYQIEFDTMGTATWAASGGSVSPSTGNGTTFTASQSPGSGLVELSAYDSGTRYVDSAYPRAGSAYKALGFTIIPPNGMNSALYADNTPGIPGSNVIGAKSTFDCIVLPTRVSFYNAEFRENIPGDTWTWPDQSQGSRTAETVPWSVGANNMTSDGVKEFGNPITKLFYQGTFHDHSHTVRVPEQYKNAAGSWVTWLPSETHPRSYLGINKSGRVGITASNGTAWGGYMGPWQ